MRFKAMTLFGKKLRYWIMAAVIGAFLFSFGSALPIQSGQTAQQQAKAQTKTQAQPQAKQPPQTPEQQEMMKLQQQIRELEKKYFELRAKGTAQRFKADMENKKKDDDLIAQLCQGAVDHKKIAYASSVDGPQRASVPAGKKGVAPVLSSIIKRYARS